MKKVNCPKCASNDVSPKFSNGGPAIYKQLVCNNCNYEGGHSRVYSGEEIRIEKEIVDRFLKKNRELDAVRTTLASMGL